MRTEPLPPLSSKPVVLKRALSLPWERHHECPGAVPALACHDEILVECDARQAREAEAWLRKAILDGMAPLIRPVPVEVETRIQPPSAERTGKPQP